MFCYSEATLEDTILDKWWSILYTIDLVGYRQCLEGNRVNHKTRRLNENKIATCYLLVLSIFFRDQFDIVMRCFWWWKNISHLKFFFNDYNISMFCYIDAKKYIFSLSFLIDCHTFYTLLNYIRNHQTVFEIDRTILRCLN